MVAATHEYQMSYNNNTPSDGCQGCCYPSEVGSMSNSSIEWTDATWNPTVGCSKVSPGCQNCYAIRSAHRMAGNPNPKISGAYAGLTERRGNRIEWTGQVNFISERLEMPLKARKPTRFFVNSMSDLFHEGVTDEQRDQIFAVMAMTPQHTYQVLTKRPERLLEYCSDRFRSRKILRAAQKFLAKGLIDPGMVAPIYPYSHIWLGVTVENQRTADERIPLLLQTPAAVRFLSCEPLLEDLNLFFLEDCPHCDVYSQGCPDCYDTGKIPVNAEGIDWVIVGGESGPGARPCDIAWIRSIVEQCQAAEVPCFVKQLGAKCYGLNRGYTGKGTNPDEWPADLRVRQFPWMEE